MFWSDSQPWLAGLVRGVLLAVIAAVIAFLTNASNDGDIPGGVVVAFPVAIYVLRQLEAIVLDQFRDKQDRMTPDL